MMEYEIEYRDGIFFVRTSGQFEVEGAKQYFAELFGHPQWRAGALLLVDHSALKHDESQNRVYQNVEGIVQELAKYREKLRNTRIAAVYSYGNKVAVDLGLYETLADHLHIPMERKVFQNTEDALRWLKQVDEKAVP